jgi:hypothetical protein
MTTVNYNDPYQTAVTNAENSGKYYGQVNVSASFVILTKGVGKSTYVEGNHDPKDRRTEISFTLNPIEEMGMSNLVQRSMLSESREWSGIVWPALRDGCGLTQLRDLDNKYVKAELVKNGRTWPDKKTGEIREGTTLKFIAIYKTEAECKTAYAEDGNAPRTAAPTHIDDVSAIDMSPGAGNTANDAEKEVAKKFLETLVKQSAGNSTMLNQMLAGMPMITKYYPVGSPEITQMLQAA